MVLQALNECRRQRLAAPRTGTTSGFDPHRIVTNRSIRLVLAIATETNGLLVLVVLVNNESFGFGIDVRGSLTLFWRRSSGKRMAWGFGCICVRSVDPLSPLNVRSLGVSSFFGSAGTCGGTSSFLHSIVFHRLWRFVVIV